MKNYDYLIDPDFVGFYSHIENKSVYGEIDNSDENAQNYYLLIINSLDSDIYKEAEKRKLIKAYENEEEFVIWKNSSSELFKKYGIKWIKILNEEPDLDFAENECYYVSCPEEKIICTLDDIKDSQYSYIVYRTKGENKCKPKFYAIKDYNEDEYDEDDEDFED